MSAPERFRLHDAAVRIDSMPVTGRDIVLAVDAEERAELARLLGVSSVDSLEAKLHAVKFRGGFRVTGDVKATVVQPSVVTLEPLTQLVAESIDRVFLPGSERDYAGPANAEIFVDLEGDDLPDHFEGNEADLTDLIIETLALGIDLYPRGEGEAVEKLGIKLDPPEESPFAVLEALKKKS
jgi:uncharacterized metal-binding protein YceD (DUF177 family)